MIRRRRRQQFVGPPHERAGKAEVVGRRRIRGDRRGGEVVAVVALAIRLEAGRGRAPLDGDGRVLPTPHPGEVGEIGAD